MKKAIAEEKSSEEPMSVEVGLEATYNVAPTNQNSTFVVQPARPVPATPIRNDPPPGRDSYQV